MTDDKMFLNVTINSENKSECSPVQTDPSWRGIVINGPKAAYIDIANRDDVVAYANVPVCGYSQLEVLKVRGAGNKMLVAKNIESGEVFEGPIVFPEPDDDIELMPSDIADLPPFTDAELEGTSAGSYFNFNLTQLVAIPKASGKYEIEVRFGEFVSNSIIIEFFE